MNKLSDLFKVIDSKEIVPATPPKKLPGSVVVLSADGETWAKEWGAQSIEGRAGTGFVLVENANHIAFGPVKKTWRIPTHMTLLSRDGTQLFEWFEINRHDKLVIRPGDTLNFAPGMIKVTIDYAPPQSRRQMKGRRELLGQGPDKPVVS